MKKIVIIIFTCLMGSSQSHIAHCAEYGDLPAAIAQQDPSEPALAQDAVQGQLFSRKHAFVAGAAVVALGGLYFWRYKYIPLGKEVRAVRDMLALTRSEVEEFRAQNLLQHQKTQSIATKIGEDVLATKVELGRKITHAEHTTISQAMRLKSTMIDRFNGVDAKLDDVPEAVVAAIKNSTSRSS